MASNTPSSCRNLVIYEVFVRNHGPNGNFSDLLADLGRIKLMGVDVIWLMPIHPIGKINRKGSLGSPYSIVDYQAVNPEYGTLEEFLQFVEKAHSLGLKVWIDVVFNHTAHDSIYVSKHPDWYHQDAKGFPVTTVPEWSDVIDLKHPNPELDNYLINTLKGWVSRGIDGFRCDVASLLPEEFWVRAREEIRKVNPDVIWLAESVHANFVGIRRTAGLPAISDSEIYRGFDITYDYDIWPIWQLAVQGKVPLSRYFEMLRFQDCIYPENYVKMRCVENHDQARIMKIAPSQNQAIAWTMFQAFNPGAFLIYAGQESGAVHTPSLFDRDPIQWGQYSLQPLLTSLATLKKDSAVSEGKFIVLNTDPVVQVTWYSEGNSLYGVFNLNGAAGLDVQVRIPDGVYSDILSNAEIVVQDGFMNVPATAAVLRYSTPIHLEFFYSDLLNYHFPAS